MSEEVDMWMQSISPEMGPNKNLQPKIILQVLCLLLCYYCNTNNLQQEWNYEILEEAGLPRDFLPKVVDSGEDAGELVSAWYGIPAGTPVIASLGKQMRS